MYLVYLELLTFMFLGSGCKRFLIDCQTIKTRYPWDLFITSSSQISSKTKLP